MMRPSGRRWTPCVVIGMAALMAGCATTKPRPGTVAAPATADEIATTTPTQTVQPTPAVPGSVQMQASPWQRLRSRFAMPGCDYDAAVLKQAQRYTKSKDRFSANWREAMPFLLLVIDEIERRDLPGEFALLPYVESHYRPAPARNRGPAGPWQLMPRTAIDQGLRISRDYDERLDLIASTRVALDLLERYDRQFADWRLASMAFNAGEFRVKGALGGRKGADLSAADMARLRLSPTTHQHLARLLALACIVSDPDRFDVSLPQPDASDDLAVVELPAVLDPRLAAALAGISLDELVRYNPAAASRAANSAPLRRLLLPKPLVEPFNAALLTIPEDRRSHWTVRRVDRPVPLATLATDSFVPIELLAAANGLAPGAELRADQELLVPGRDSEPHATGEPQVHVVRAGDTLSAIAKRYDLSLGELLEWNSLGRKSMLRIGMRLRIHAPEY